MVFLTEGNMMLKQYYRVKQMADQKFAGAERTEMLNDDLVNKEKQVDILRQVCLNTCKQIKSCIQGQGTDGASLDKRLKKLPDFSLGSTMLEHNTSLWESSILGQVLGLCGRIQCDLAQHVLTFEVEVERLVLAKYIEILETDIPNINKQRKQLSKLTLDYDSTKSRYQQLVKPSVQTPAYKIDNIKQEYDDAKQKVENCKDALTTELYAVLAKETDLARCLYQLMISKADYHRRALQVLECAIPTISNAIQECHGKPAYGVPLSEHLEAGNRRIALPIEKSICCLLQYGIEEEGILRIAGSASKVKKLKNSFDVGIVNMNDYDPPAIAGAMKQYLRELPEPLMTFQLYDEWMDIAKFPDKESKLEAIRNILPKLPKANYDNLRFLIKFLAKVASFQDVNKMSSQNIAIVIAINLIWSPDEEQLGMNMGLANTRSAIVDLLVSHADELFPGDEDFNLPDADSLEISVPMMDLSTATAMVDFNENETESAEMNQTQITDPIPDVRRTSFSKTILNSEMSKEGEGMLKESGGSPKEGATSPKIVRRFKKQAPPVPPPPKEHSDKFTGDKTKSQANNTEEKPAVPFKPRHTRTSSGVSLDSNRALSSTSVSDVEGAMTSSSSKDLSCPHDNEEPQLRSNFRASFPVGFKLGDDSESKTSSFRSVLHASSVLKEKAKSIHDSPFFGSEAKDFLDRKINETAPELTHEIAAADENNLNGKQPSKCCNVVNHGPPGRPPRPQLPTPNEPPQQNETASVTNVISLPQSASQLLNSEVNNKSKSRNAYVNIPPSLEAFKSEETISLKNTTPSENAVVNIEDNREDVEPPERPKKFDKTKVVLPVRPEKSEKLRAMLNLKTGAAPSPKIRGNEESPSKCQTPTQHKDKPLRPPPCSAIIMEKDKSSSPVIGSQIRPESIYPVLSELELANVEDIDFNLPRPSSAESPVAPKRQARPQPQPRMNYPTAKPRSITNSVATPEQTHL